MLVEINFSGIATNGGSITASIYRRSFHYGRFFGLTSTGDNEYRIVFKHPIVIEPNEQYVVIVNNANYVSTSSTRFLSEVKMRDGTLIKFTDCLGPVSRLVFRKTKIQNHSTE